MPRYLIQASHAAYAAAAFVSKPQDRVAAIQAMTEKLGGTKSLGTEVDSVAPRRVRGMHNDGLQDAVLADVVCKLLDLRLGELRARVARAFVELSQGNDERTPVIASGRARR